MPTLTTRADIARAMYSEVKEVFKDNLMKQPEEQWKSYATIKNSVKASEKYETIGNLKPAHTKAEGDPVVYGDINQAYETIITNETVANGFAVTMEAKEDEQWGIVPTVKVQELVRTIINQREVRVANIWDTVTTTAGADGAMLAGHNHPLLEDGVNVNDNLIDLTFNIDTYDLANQRFNHWRNHYGEKFYTTPSAMLLNRDRQTQALAMLQSTLRPFENSNTKNTIPQLKLIFSSYIKSLPVHLLDETIDTAIFQQRKKLTDDYDYDNRSTFNWYYNVHERYKAGMINCGFGFVTITGVAGTAKVFLYIGSLGVAGNATITGLTTGTKYTVYTGGKYYGVKADGTLGAEDSSAVALGVGITAITGLTNGGFYDVQVEA